MKIDIKTDIPQAARRWASKAPDEAVRGRVFRSLAPGLAQARCFGRQRENGGAILGVSVATIGSAVDSWFVSSPGGRWQSSDERRAAAGPGFMINSFEWRLISFEWRLFMCSNLGGSRWQAKALAVTDNIYANWHLGEFHET